MASDSTNGLTIGAIDDSGTLFAKSGISGGWVPELGNVRAVTMASDSTNGLTIGAIDDSGTLFAKSGISGGWVPELGSVEVASTGSGSSLRVSDAPIDVSAAPLRAGALVSFRPGPFDGGSSVEHYSVSGAPGGDLVTGTRSPIHIVGLVPGRKYSFTVSTTDAVGLGPYSTASNVVIPGRVATQTRISVTSHGARATFNAVVSGQGVSPTGDVTFLMNGKQVCSKSISKGHARCQTAQARIGVNRLRVMYVGDSSCAPSGALTSFTRKQQVASVVAPLNL